jgi:hypothetical protein
MEITRDSLPWDSEDTDIWNSFLSTKTGQRLLPKILESTPALLASGDINSILIRSGEVRGFQASAGAILSLAMHPEAPVKETSSYPPLEDDSQWNDGQKIQPQPQ